MKTILLIDDDPAILEPLKLAFQDVGWTVHCATNGEEGLILAKTKLPDYVICDLLLPGINGFQICREIRALPTPLCGVKIIVVSGSDYKSDKDNALEAGADAYLVKPAGFKKLCQTLEELDGPDSIEAESDAKVPSEEVVSDDRCRILEHKITFWGVRGSVPCPGKDTVKVGGNTSCVELRADGEILILDAGTGIRQLGIQLSREFKEESLKATVLISHTHWDHIQGFPFFLPAYIPKNRIRILGFEGARIGLETTLKSQMESPYFPITMQEMPSNIHIAELKDMSFQVGSIQVEVCFLNHPGVCVGYRMKTSRASIAYIPDNEPYQRLRVSTGADTELVQKFASDQDQKLIQFVMGVDVLIIDSQYDAEEYESHRGWGHGCLDDVVALGMLAKVKKLYLFHHDPGHDDDRIAVMEAHARGIVERSGSQMQVEAAREGSVIRF